jgi:AcrR family transcriptional regulator
MAIERTPTKPPSIRPGRVDGKRAQNRRRRLQQLQDAALPLFIEQGIERVTIDDIVKAAGIAKGSFYRYYQDKEELVSALFEPLIEHLGVAFERGERALKRATAWTETLSAFGQIAFDVAPLLIMHRDAFLVYLQENRGPETNVRRPVHALAALISDRAFALTHVARTHGNLRDVDPAVTSLAVIGAAERLALEFLRGGRIAEPAAAASALVMVIMDGLQVRTRA